MMNKFLVGGQGDSIVFMKPLPQKMDKNDALILAAWIVALADPAEENFKKVLEEVCSS